MDPKKKLFLFRQSQNFCSVPWNHLFVYPNGEVKTCVMGQQTLGNIQHQSLEEISRGPVISHIRQTLYNDQPHENCVTCHGMTHSEHNQRYNFIRDMYNRRFLHSDVDYSRCDEFVLGGIDLHWDNTCNLRCVSCWPLQSSAIAKELKVHVPKPGLENIKDMIDFIVNNQHSLKEIYFSGGEPTLIKHNLELLDRLTPRADLLLRVNSNFTWQSDNKIFAAIMRFPNVLFTASIDGMERRFEYMRAGADWQRVVDNMDLCAKSHARMRVNTVFSVLTATTMIHSQHWLTERFGITDFTINQCGMDQFSIMARNLPPGLKPQIMEQMQQEISQTQDANLSGQLANCVKELSLPPNTYDYRTYLDGLDQRRGSQWRVVFPELA